MTATLPNAPVDALRRTVRGALLLPDDAGFAEATELWNGMVDKTPAIVVTAADTTDVVAAIGFAREYGLALSVRSGGHHIAGTALADGGLTIDLSRLRRIEVDADGRTANVGAGCRLGEIDAATQRYGLATPLGFISNVGVSGLTLGGGLGYLTRRYGWTADNLIEVEIVTADGVVRRASRSEHADLFWAVRGAGANFGVVTELKYRLHPVGPNVYGGLIAWPFERADEILAAYRAITTGAPRELAVWLVLLSAPPAPFIPQEWHGRKLCAMAVCYSGDPEETDSALAPIRAIGDPVVNLLAEQPYQQIQSYLNDTEPAGMHYYWRTEYLASLGDELLSTVRELFDGCSNPLAEIGFLHLDGALNEHPEDDGAVGNRDARYVVGIKGMWAPDEADVGKFAEWVRVAGERVRPLGTGRTYINFQSADEPDARVRATYGPNYERLVELKRAYDPNNLFSSNRNIPV